MSHCVPLAQVIFRWGMQKMKFTCQLGSRTSIFFSALHSAILQNPNSVSGTILNFTITKRFSRSVWSRAMFDKRTDHGNDVMVTQFGFLLLARAIFRETSSTIDIKTVKVIR